MEQIHWFPGHMAKAIKLIDQQIKLIDLIIEIVDSRIPQSSSNNIIDKLRGNKPKLTILNKSDLADPVVTAQWIKLYSADNNLLLDSKHKNITNIVIKKIMNILKSKLLSQQNKGIINPKMKVLVAGIPNVGKSTFINNVVKKQVTKIGNKPGVTKGQQWIKLNQTIDLIDSPGILPPKISDEITGIKLALARTIKEEILPLEKIAFFALQWLKENYLSNLLAAYPKLTIENIQTNNDEECYYTFLLLQKMRFGNINEEQIERIYHDFLMKIWNNQMGLLSFEKPM